MNKPSWDDAPKWARYLAIDRDGSRWWHESEPIPGDYGWYAGGDSVWAGIAERGAGDWRKSLEQRPS